MKTPLNRRHFLRSSSALIALPFLESLGFRRFAAAAPVPPRPKRMVFIGIGWGVTQETWYPDVKQTGAEWTLPEGLKPLAKHQKDITVIQNCFHKHFIDPHSCSTFWLTGANKYGVPGKSFSNTISVDQVAAEKFGKDTRFTSLVLSGSGESHGPGLSLAWNRQGKPVAGLDNPVATFHKLFSDENTPLAQRQAELKRQQSVLDTVLVDARDLARGLGKEDNDKLGEYLDSIRDIEIQLSKEGQWLDVPKPKPADAIAEPKQAMSGDKETPPVIAYTSTPFRGLDLLLEAFGPIRREIPGTRLRIYSSMKVYQVPASEDEAAYGALYRRCREMGGVEYIGSLPQPELARALRSVAVLAYPNTFAETSCISVMEALAAGCAVVTSHLGALPETCAGFARLVPVGQARERYLAAFVKETVAALRALAHEDEAEMQIRRQRDEMNRTAIWPMRARQWVRWLESLS